MSIVVYLFCFIERSEQISGLKPNLNALQKIVLVAVGLAGVLSLAFFIGRFGKGSDLVHAVMIAGGLFGLFVSRLLIGRPKLGKS
jgi:hypothetical protein